jgi:hypothetical protein
MAREKVLISSSKIDRRWLLGIGVVLFSFMVGGVLWADEDDDDHRARIRWDIVNIFTTGGATAGGEASAEANQPTNTTPDFRITISGSGTFPATGGPSDHVTGGGRWEVRNMAGVVTGRGRFKVTGLVRWDVAPGTFPPINDNIGDADDARAGLAVLRVRYSDGKRGILVLSCHLNGTPDSVFEGITASRGFVDFWDHEEPVAGVDGNRTLFHVVRRHDDN